jgi:hypothetical protein
MHNNKIDRYYLITINSQFISTIMHNLFLASFSPVISGFLDIYNTRDKIRSMCSKTSC